MGQKTTKSKSPHIPEDIVLNIHSRLPIKSQVRFKCVAKAWRSLPIATERQHVIFWSNFYCNGNVRSISAHDDDSYKELPIPCAQDEEFSSVDVPSVRLLGSCKGLLLVSHGEDISLWNPSTGVCKKVLSCRYLSSRARGVMSGICYDSSSDDYKVVIASEHDILADKLAEVSSLRRKNWKAIKLPYSIFSPNSGPLVNGNLHWLLWKLRGTDGVFPQKRVVCFDPARSKFKEVPIPQPMSGVESIFILGLGALDGRLAIAQQDRESWCSEDDIIKVWTMKQYGVRESWSVLFILQQRSDLCLWFWVLEPLCYRKDGKVLFNVEREQIVACDTKDKSPPDTLWDRGYIDVAVMYEESLISPDDLVKTKEQERLPKTRETLVAKERL